MPDVLVAPNLISARVPLSSRTVEAELRPETASGLDRAASQRASRSTLVSAGEGERRQVPAGHYTVVDLFAGTGAFSFGLRMAGLDGPSLLVDSARDCIVTCRANHPESVVIKEDVNALAWDSVSADVVVGGPPCQGFSNLGKRDASDPRNEAYRGLLHCVEQVRPQLLALENVPAFLRSSQAQDLTDGLTKLGYTTRCDVVDAAHFGVPQHRKRALLISAPRGRRVPWPRVTHGGDLLPLRTVSEAFAGLPRQPDGRAWHVSAPLSTAYVERLKAVPIGGGRRDLPPDLELACWRGRASHSDVMGRLGWTRPATTLRTSFHRPEKGRSVHPTEDRAITPREAARIQGFPDDFEFPSTLKLYTVARQIGNAVPVPLARAIGLEFARDLR